MKKIYFVLVLTFLSQFVFSQFNSKKFGQGLEVVGKDSTFLLNTAFRFQSLYVSEWNVRDDDFNFVEDYSANFLIRRARLKFKGWVLTSKLKYKMELGLSNRDLSGGNSSEYRFASRMILDAYLDWNFHKNFSILLGQNKMPGNRDRLISSSNMQFVDRSRLNARFTLDRDMGVMLKHQFTVGDNFKVKEIFALAQGEGRNVTEGNYGGFSTTFKLEFFPLGDFQSKGAYVGSDIKRESKPKLAVAFAFDRNQNAVRERGQLGRFIIDENGNYIGKTLNTFFTDFMFKYKGFSMMGEYAYRITSDGSENVLDVDDNDEVIGTYYTGSGLNVQAGYLFKSNYEIAFRYTSISPQTIIVGSQESEFTLGASKYIVGHKLKVQSDFGYRKIENIDDKLFWRFQVEFHF